VTGVLPTFLNFTQVLLSAYFSVKSSVSVSSATVAGTASDSSGSASAQDKQAHLGFYQVSGNFAVASGWRERRDAVKESDHHQKTPLPAHASDLAIKEAYETELKYWANIAEQIEVSGRDWTDEQKHYANWLLYDAQSLSKGESRKAVALHPIG